MQHRGYDRPIAYGKKSAGIENAALMWDRLKMTWELPDVLQMVMQFDATEPRDKIFAARGLYSRDAPAPLFARRKAFNKKTKVDYEMPVSQVYTLATRFAIRELYSLHVLRYCSLDIDVSDENSDVPSPSWVLRYDIPNSSLDERTQICEGFHGRWYLFQTQRKRAETGADSGRNHGVNLLSYDWRALRVKDPNVLTVRGAIVGTVTSVGSAVKRMPQLNEYITAVRPLSATRLPLTDCLQDWRVLEQSPSNPQCCSLDSYGVPQQKCGGSSTDVREILNGRARLAPPNGPV